MKRTPSGNRAAVLFLGFLLALPLTGAAQTPPAEVPPQIERTLTQGMRGNDVRAVQTWLKALGPSVYPEGLVTGYFGRLTAAAWARAAKKFGLSPSTALSPQSLQTIVAIQATIYGSPLLEGAGGGSATTSSTSTLPTGTTTIPTLPGGTATSTATSSAPTPPPPPLPNQVQGLTASVSGSSVTLRWNALTTVPATWYNIYRSTTPNLRLSPYMLQEKVRVITLESILSHTLTNVPAGTYYYRVAAEDGSGIIYPTSNEVAVTVATFASLASPSDLASALATLHDLLVRLSLLIR